MKKTVLALALLSGVSMADGDDWTAYIVNMDFNGDGVTENALVEPWYDLGDQQDVGRVVVTMQNDVGGETEFIVYGEEAGDALGNGWHDVRGLRMERLHLSVGDVTIDPECRAVIYWDGEWNTQPINLRYYGCD